MKGVVQMKGPTRSGCKCLFAETDRAESRSAGRNGASTFTGAERVTVLHEALQPEILFGMRLWKSAPLEGAKNPGAHHRAGAFESDCIGDPDWDLAWLTFHTIGRL